MAVITEEKHREIEISNPELKTVPASYTFTDSLHHIEKKNTYVCDSCGKTFLHKNDLIDHVKTHQPEHSELLTKESNLFIRESIERVSCKICNKKFRKNYIKIHELFHTGAKPYSCGVCKKEFAVMSSLKEHKRMHTEERPYACDVCKKSFSRLYHLKTHKRSHSGEKPYTCEICEKVFTHISNLKSHIRIHTGEKPYECPFCEKRFSHWSSLAKHKRLHTGDNPYSCEICKEKFIHLSSLNTHKVIHAEVNVGKTGARHRLNEDLDIKDQFILALEPVQCPKIVKAVNEAKCREIGISNPELKTVPGSYTFTDSLHYIEKKNTFVCDSCGKTFLHKYDLIDHVKTHQRGHSKSLTKVSKLFIRECIEKVSCKICNKKYRKNYIKIHERFHTGAKPYSCEVCKKEFTILGSLKEHIRIHTEERPYSCDVCKKSFSRLNHLKMHRRSHSGEKPYTCGVCKKGFAQISNLKSHTRIHTGEKPYECTICEKRFAQGSALETHKRTHTGDKPYSCEICKMKFMYVSSLNTHKCIHAEVNVGNTGARHGLNDDAVIKGPQPIQWPEIANAVNEEKCREIEISNPELKTVPASYTFTDSRHHIDQINTYVCDSCGKTFLHKHELIDHAKTHLLENSESLTKESNLFIRKAIDKVSCKICNKKFRKNYIKIHEQCHTGAKPYTCEVCKKEFGNLCNLKNHERIHTDERPYSCDVCKKSFTRSDHLKTHKRTHSGDKPYTCEVCKRGFAQLNNLKSHIRIHTGEKPYECPICEKRFAQGSALETHKRTHSGDKPYSCEICKKKFKLVSSLHTHKCIHTEVNVCNTGARHGLNDDAVIKDKFVLGPQPIQWPKIANAVNEEPREEIENEIASPGLKTVPGSYTFTDSLHYIEKKSTYVCDSRGKTLLHKHDLIDHVKTHQPENSESLTIEPNLVIRDPKEKVSCKICHKKYGKNYIKIHERCHTGVKPYSCEVCKKEFADLANLRSHERIHTKERPYSCDVCKKEFADLGNLRSHKRIHTKERPYSCDVCKKSFIRSDHLKTHKRTHSVVKPYTCEVCKRGFAQLNNLKIHTRSHTTKDL